jgi:hypothetical protein
MRSVSKRVHFWQLRGAARGLLQQRAPRSLQLAATNATAMALAARRRRSDGLSALWDPQCQLPLEPMRDPPPFFVELCVSSELDQRIRRDAIREGYGKFAANLSASLRFFVGEPQPGTHDAFSIESERRRFGDVVILPMVDSYENLTLKTLAMLSYAAACGSAKYVVKADDDVLVFIRRLQRFTEKMDAEAYSFRGKLGVYTGTLWVNTPPILAKGNKNEESKWVISSGNASEPPLSRGKHFFSYAGGPFYLMSRSAAEYLRGTADRLNWKWRNEDMAVGAWLVGSDVDFINTFQVKVLHWRWSTKPYIAEHNIDNRHEIAAWHVRRGNETLLL